MLNEYVGVSGLMTSITPTIPMSSLYIRLNTLATEEQTFTLADSSGNAHTTYTLQPNTITKIDYAASAYADVMHWATIPEDGDNTIEIWAPITATHNATKLGISGTNIIASSTYFAEGDTYIKVESAETNEHVFTAQPDATSAGVVVTNELTPLITSTSTMGFSISPALPEDAVVYLYYPKTITTIEEE